MTTIACHNCGHTIVLPDPISAILITPEQAAELLAIGRSTMWTLIAAGQFETVRVGRSRRVVAQSVMDYVGRLRTTVD